jgi:hypothetical protein
VAIFSEIAGYLSTLASPEVTSSNFSVRVHQQLEKEALLEGRCEDCGRAFRMPYGEILGRARAGDSETFLVQVDAE